ncbi:hypothetical protein S40288_09294 [Stachybotrys chartarum IBT 40288]|nr:hypothetical protein S40288_09294 [Stachybotrys chartarum IBT 40288]
MSSTGSNSSEHGGEVGFVPDPDGRGTIGIMMVCFAVILLNTWTLIHPNIPPHDQSEWRNWVHKVNLALIAAFAPDAVAASAFSQWRAARRAFADLKDELPWWTLEHAFYAEMGGYRVMSRTTGQEFAFRSTQIAWLHRRRLIEIPSVDKESLEERSKAEPIGKFLACCQSTWFLVSILARIHQGLPLTTLEAELFPYVGVTWLVYFWWWRKPMQLVSYTKVPIDNMTPHHLVEMAKATCCFDKAPPWWRPMPQEMHPRGWDYYWMIKRFEIKKLRFENTVHLIPPSVRDGVHMTMAEWQIADWYRGYGSMGFP